MNFWLEIGDDEGGVWKLFLGLCPVRSSISRELAPLRPVEYGQYLVCQKRHLPMRDGTSSTMHDRMHTFFRIGLKPFDFRAARYEGLEYRKIAFSNLRYEKFEDIGRSGFELDAKIHQRKNDPGCLVWAIHRVEQIEDSL